MPKPVLGVFFAMFFWRAAWDRFFCVFEIFVLKLELRFLCAQPVFCKDFQKIDVLEEDIQNAGC